MEHSPGHAQPCQCPPYTCIPLLGTCVSGEWGLVSSPPSTTDRSLHNGTHCGGTHLLTPCPRVSGGTPEGNGNGTAPHTLQLLANPLLGPGGRSASCPGSTGGRSSGATCSRSGATWPPCPPLQGRLLRDLQGSERAPPATAALAGHPGPGGCPACFSGDVFGFTAHFTVRKTVMRNEHHSSLQIRPR